MTMIQCDEAFDFGLGVFETIAIENRHPILVQEHLQRIENSMRELGIHNADFSSLVSIETIEKQAQECPPGRYALKISVSPKNVLFSVRASGYTPGDYERGFRLTVSSVLRNETSPLTYHKTMNYGDNMIEKRRAKAAGYDEPLFVNTKGFVSEGATTNLFCIKKEQIFTPSLSCGLLNGILRQYVMVLSDVKEYDFTLAELLNADEIFVTNSLLGIMPVSSLDGRNFPCHEKTLELMAQYQEMIR